MQFGVNSAGQYSAVWCSAGQYSAVRCSAVQGVKGGAVSL